MRRHRWLRALSAGIALLAAGCTTSPTAPIVAVQPTGARVVYVAIGASDALGFGATDPIRQAWPQVFFDTALPAGATFVNLGIAGATVQDALAREAPYASSLGPTLVTVLLGVNDIRAGVPASTYGEQLRRLLEALRRGGSTQVLVGNVPPLDHLPAYLACLPNPPPGGPPCSLTGRFPAPKALDATVTAYNEETAAAVSATGSVLVDIHAAGLAARQDATESANISSDGFHPSAEGHKVMASVFAHAYAAVAPKT